MQIKGTVKNTVFYNAENGYTVSGAETVTNEADSATVTVVYSATENKNSNEFTQPLAITGWTYGETANTPTAVAKFTLLI